MYHSMFYIGSAAAIASISLLLSLFFFSADQSFQLFSLPTQATAYDSERNITYRGVLQSDVEHFQNIFYAEDTSGPNRFAPPVKYTYAPGTTVDATQSGAWCPQGLGDVLPFTSKVLNVSENCLSLRIARPYRVRPIVRLPVMVWLHGGGHALGSAYERLYEPDGLISQAKNDGRPIVWVAVNYRLGFFGFATGEALLQANHTNAGLRDQRAALEWIRDNIQVFGGDPDRVTVVGQSVGASDISLQLVAFDGTHEAPFQQAILMSGGPGLNFNTDSRLVADNTALIAKRVGCGLHNDDTGVQSDSTLACLREAAVDQLTAIAVEVSRAARPPFGEGFFYPTKDNDFLTQRPSELMRSGKFSKNISIITSWVTNDGAWYAQPTVSDDNQVLASFGIWLQGLSLDTQNRLLELYPITDFDAMVRPAYDGPISPQYYRAAQLNRDLWFTCPVLDFAWQYTRNGGVDAKTNVRLYEHNATRFTSSFESMGVPMWRVAHLSDIPYVLNSRHIKGVSVSDSQLSRLVSGSIVRFVYSGSPEDGLVSWPPAFQDVSDDSSLGIDLPQELTLQLFGGPFGSRSVLVSRGDTNESVLTNAEHAIRWEKLFARCDFINSPKVRKEIGV